MIEQTKEWSMEIFELKKELEEKNAELKPRKQIMSYKRSLEPEKNMEIKEAREEGDELRKKFEKDLEKRYVEVREDWNKL